MVREFQDGTLAPDTAPMKIAQIREVMCQEGPEKLLLILMVLF